MLGARGGPKVALSAPPAAPPRVASPPAERETDAPARDSRPAAAASPMSDRIARQLAFATEIDALKSIERMISLVGGARRENSAEHSWHLAVLVPVLVEHAPADTDPLRAMQMVLIHDIVEIDAGDAFAFDPEAQAGQVERERAAAERIFGLLPTDQAEAYRELWEEFEAKETATARFANAIDRLQALLLNRANGGGTWVKHGVTRTQVLDRMRPIRDWTPALWPVVLETVEGAGLEG